MGFLVLKKIVLLFILISASLLSTSFAGGQLRFMGKTAIKAAAECKETWKEESTDIHERILKANTKDYGYNDPAPALGKPPSKLIPN